MATFRVWLEKLKDYVDVPLLKLGSAQLTILTVIYLAVFTVLLFYLSAKLRNWVANQFLTRTKMDLGARQRPVGGTDDDHVVELGDVVDDAFDPVGEGLVDEAYAYEDFFPGLDVVDVLGLDQA